MVVGGSGSWWIYFGWWCVLVDIFWLVAGRGGLWWVVVGREGWWHSLVWRNIGRFRKARFRKLMSSLLTYSFWKFLLESKLLFSLLFQLLLEKDESIHKKSFLWTHYLLIIPNKKTFSFPPFQFRKYQNESLRKSKQLRTQTFN